MPVPLESNYLLQTVTRCGGASIISSLQSFLQNKPDMPQDCSAHLMKKLQKEFKLIHQSSVASVEDIQKTRVLLQVIQQLATYREQPGGMMVLLQHGLSTLISDTLMSALHAVRTIGNRHVDEFYEDVLETINSVADYSQAAKGVIAEAFCDRLLQVVCTPNLRFSIRMETLKRLNLVLERCPIAIREKLRKSTIHRELMQKLGQLIPTIGDYEFQVALTETLFRLTYRTERDFYARDWFQDQETLQAFLRVQDSHFETDCREFLNVVNMVNAQDRETSSVISLPCLRAFLGEYQLEKPDDACYRTFWVDFNTGSHRISLFCNQQPTDSAGSQEEGLWETVSVWDEDVHTYTVRDRVTDSSTTVTVQLKGLARDLIGFGTDYKTKSVTLEFSPSLDIQSALERTYGKAKSQEQRKTRASAAEYPVQVNKPEPQIPETIVEEDDPTSANNLSQRSGQSHSQQTPRRMKVSVPALPMSTPNSLLAAGAPMMPTGSATTRHHNGTTGDAVTPKLTSQPVSAKRVKTPLKMLHTETCGPGHSKVSVARSSAGAKKFAATSTKEQAPESVVVTKRPGATSTKEQAVESVVVTKRSRTTRQQSQQSQQSQPSKTADAGGSRPMRRTRNRTAAAAAAAAADVEVVPSSAPEEQVTVVPDSQPLVTSLHLPALNTPNLHLSLSEAVTSEGATYTQEEIRQESKMMELKERLAAIDSPPDYVKNMYKASHTPSLSTVTEESAAARTSVDDMAEHTEGHPNRTQLHAAEKLAIDKPSTCLAPTVQQMSPDSTSQPQRGPAKNAKKSKAAAGGKVGRKGRGKGRKWREAQHSEEQVPDMDCQIVELDEEVIVESPKSRSSPKSGQTRNKTVEAKSGASKATSQTDSPTGMKPAVQKFSIFKSKNTRVELDESTKETSQIKTPAPNGETTRSKAWSFAKAPSKVAVTFVARKERILPESQYSDYDKTGHTQDVTAGRAKPGSDLDLCSPCSGLYEFQSDGDSVSGGDTVQQSSKMQPKATAKTSKQKAAVKKPAAAKKSAAAQKAAAAPCKKDKANRSKKAREGQPDKQKEAEEDLTPPAKTHTKWKKGDNDFARCVATSFGFDEEAEGYVLHDVAAADSPARHEVQIADSPVQQEVRAADSPVQQEVKTADSPLQPEAGAADSPVHYEVQIVDSPVPHEMQAADSPMRQEHDEVDTNSEVQEVVQKKPMRKKRHQNAEVAEVSKKLAGKKQQMETEVEEIQKKPTRKKQQTKYAEADEVQTKPMKKKQQGRKPVSQWKTSALRRASDEDVVIEDCSQDPDILDLHFIPGSLSAEQQTADEDADESSSGQEEGVTSFAKLCQGIVDRSGAGLRSRSAVCYKEVSESDVDSVSSTLEPNKVHDRAPRLKQGILNQKKRQPRKKKKSVFSETDETTDARSEVSWLASTARKKKPRLEKDYTHTAKMIARPRLIPKVELLDEEERTEVLPKPTKAPCKPKKPAHSKKRKCEEEVDTLGDELYYQPPSKKQPGVSSANRVREEVIRDEVVTDSPDYRAPGTWSAQSMRNFFSNLGAEMRKTPTTPCVTSLLHEESSIERGRFANPVASSLTAAAGVLVSPLTPAGRSSQTRSGSGIEIDLECAEDVELLSDMHTPSAYRTPSMQKAVSVSDSESVIQEDAVQLRSGPCRRQTPWNISIHQEGMVEDTGSEAAESGQGSGTEGVDPQQLPCQTSIKPRRLFAEIDVEEGQPEDGESQDDHQREYLAEDEDDASRPSSRDEDPEEDEEEEEEEEEAASREDAEERHAEQHMNLAAGTGQDLGVQTGISTLIKSFGTDLQRNLTAKRRCLEEYTQNTLSVTQKQVSMIWGKQLVQRKQVLKRYKGALVEELADLEKDVEKNREAEKEAVTFFMKQQKVLQATRLSQEHRLKKLAKMQSTFVEEMKSVDDTQMGQQDSVREVLRKEMQVLQRRILKQSQQQEMMNVKKSLQAMFY